MKKITSLLVALILVLASVFAVQCFATDVEKIENKGKPKLTVECEEKVKDGDILILKISLSGCAELTSADLKFEYNPKVLSFLGGSVLGKCAGDTDFYYSVSDTKQADENSSVALSFFHKEKLSVEEGNGEFFELAFRTGKGRSSVKAVVDSFCINDEDAKLSVDKYSYFSGISSYLKTGGSSVFVCAVIAVVVIVLIVLLIVIKKMKKKVEVRGFDPEIADNTEDGSAEIHDNKNGDGAEAVTETKEESEDKSSTDEDNGNTEDEKDNGED